MTHWCYWTESWALAKAGLTQLKLSMTELSPVELSELARRSQAQMGHAFHGESEQLTRPNIGRHRIQTRHQCVS